MIVRLTSIGDGTAQGALEGHPAGTMVRTYLCADGLAISLWDYAHRIGEGLLKRDGNRWVGTCSEFLGTWRVSGVVKSGVLEFEDEVSHAND